MDTSNLIISPNAAAYVRSKGGSLLLFVEQGLHAHGPLSVDGAEAAM